MTVAGSVVINVGDGGSTLALERALAALEKRMQQVGATGTQLSSTTSSLGSQFSALSSAAGQFGIALGAGAIAREALDLAHLGAQAASARDSFTNLAQAAGTTSDTLLAKLHAAAAGTVSDTQLMVASNTGLLLVGEKIATALPRLLEIARASAKATGQDVSFLYDSLVRGIARGSPKIIDNAGITLDAAAAMDTYAKSIGKTADALTSSEQQQATLNAVLATGEGFINKIGLSTDSAAVKMQRAQAATDNFKAALGERLAPAIATVAEGLANLLSKGDLFAGAAGGAAQAQVTITAQAASYEDYVRRVAAANQQLRDEIGKTDPVFALIVKGLDTLSPSQFAYAQSLVATGTAQAEAVRQAQALADVDTVLGAAHEQLRRQSEVTGASFAGLEQKMLAVAATGPEAQNGILALVDSLIRGNITMPQFTAEIERLSQATLLHADAAAVDANMLAQAAPIIQRATEATIANNDALVAQAQKTLESSIQTQQLSQLQATLANLGGQVAGGLITAAQAAAILAGQYNIASGAALQLINLQAQLAGAARARQTALDRDDLQGARRNAAAPPTQSLALLQDQKRRTDELTAAEGRLAAARGNTAGQIAALRKQQEGLSETSAEYINIQAQIESIESKNAKASKARGGAKLTDQQRLNNTLLADQQRADDQREALEKAHTKRLLDIDRKFQEDSLKQQKANELSKRESEIDFLKQLTSSELNNSREGKAELARIDAQYYADFQKAQEAAQAGNLKQSEELAAQARHRADVELQYAEQIEKARQDKNKSEIERLEALREKERQLLDEQSKQIQEGGDPNVKARQEAIDDEERSFRESQGRIKDSSDAATERKIDNAVRNKKKVDEENLSYKEQEDTINRIAAARGGPPAPGTTPAAPSTTAPTPSTGAPVDLAALLGALGAIQGKLDEVGGLVKGAIDNDTRQTTAAIGRLQGTRFAQ